jgi:hypothetical protein
MLWEFFLVPELQPEMVADRCTPRTMSWAWVINCSVSRMPSSETGAYSSAIVSHEMLWEFFLVPELQPEMVADRSYSKAAVLTETIAYHHRISEIGCSIL